MGANVCLKFPYLSLWWRPEQISLSWDIQSLVKFRNWVSISRTTQFFEYAWEKKQRNKREASPSDASIIFCCFMYRFFPSKEVLLFQKRSVCFFQFWDPRAEIVIVHLGQYWRFHFPCFLGTRGGRNPHHAHTQKHFATPSWQTYSAGIPFWCKLAGFWIPAERGFSGPSGDDISL